MFIPFTHCTPRPLGRQSVAAVLLAALLFGQSTVFGEPAYRSNPAESVQIRGGISVGVKGEEIISSLALRDADVRDVLYSLSEQGGFNLIVSDDVEGTLSIDLKDTSINKVIEYIMTLMDLTYYNDGSTVIVTTRDTADERSLNKLVLKSIPVKHGNAGDIVTILNSTVFSVDRPGGNKNAVANADPRTNSILVMGNEQDIELANRALKELDLPQQHKTFFMKYANVLDVATNLNMITQALFSVSLTPETANSAAGVAGNPATASSSSSGGNTSSGSSSSGGNSSQDSSSGNSSSGGNSSDGSGASSGLTAPPVQILRGGGMVFIANPTTNTLTMMGTAEQLQRIEPMLYDLDVRSAQVAIQISIIELFETRDKGFQPGINSPVGGGRLGSSNGGLSFSGSTTTLFWDQNGTAQADWENSLRLQTTLTRGKSKVLANPTILTVSGQPATFSAQNEVFAGSEVTVTAQGTVTSTPILKSVGIMLDMKPEVFNDGTVSLQISPTISAPAGQAIDEASGNTIQLTSSTVLNASKVRIKDGETLILAGLIRENSTSGWSKVPFLGDMPILGALFRASSTNSTDRTEIVILVTPHIVKEEGVPYFRKSWKDSLSYEGGTYDQVAVEADKPKTMIPASNSLNDASYRGIQSLENRQAAPAEASGLAPVSRSSAFPLATFKEVLK